MNMTPDEFKKRPCLALMGEFSAGKSTLANLLIGCEPLPVQVIATQLPPVMISYGTDAPYRVMEDNSRHPIDMADLASEEFEGVLYIQIFATEDILLHCNLLDMPGISDPNMSSSVWERMIDRADGVLWCSHATQAWRQSEAATWESLPDELHNRSLLLLTRADKLHTAADREKVLARVRRETEGLFAEVMLISLLLATQEQDDYEAWAKSGAEAFAARLVALLAQLSLECTNASAVEAPALPGLVAPMKVPAEAVPNTAARIVPRRIQPTGPTSRQTVTNN